MGPVLMAAFRPRTAGLGGQLSRGAAWTSLPIFVRILATASLTPILARILDPRDYGIVALAALVGEFAGIFGETGFHGALIQRRRIRRIELDTAYWTQVVIGCSIGAMVALSAPLVARFLETPALADLLLLSALNFVVGAGSSVHNALMMRAMAFSQLARIELCAVAIRSVVALSLAFSGFGFWALAVAGFSALLTTIVGRWITVRWRPRLRYSVPVFLGLFQYGRHLFLSNIVSRMAMRVDVAIVGIRLGPELLGVFDLASMPPTLAREGFVKVLRRLLFPAYSRIQENRARLERAVCRVYALTSLALWPPLAGMGAVAPVFVPLYLGEQWLAAIFPMTLLSIAAMARTIDSVTVPVAQAIGRPDLLWRLGVFRLILSSIAVWVGSSWGLNGVACAVAAFTLIWNLVSASLVLGAGGLGIRPLLRATSGVLALSAAIFVGARLTLEMIRGQTDSLGLAFWGAVAAGLAIAAASLPLLWHKPEVAELRRIVFGLLQSASNVIVMGSRRLACRSNAQ